MISRNLLIFSFVVAFIISIVCTCEVTKVVYMKTTTIHALAVTDTGEGEIININVTLLWPGDGEVYISSSPLPIAQGGTFITSSKLALLVASNLANVDYRNYTVLIKPEHKVLEIGGPSASGYITVAIYSLITNKTLRNDVTMTGLILPDGLIGPVGGIPAKVKAAEKHGFKIILIPYVCKSEVENSTNVKIYAIIDVRDAIKYFTGYKIIIPKINFTKLKMSSKVVINIYKILWNKLKDRLSDKYLPDKKFRNLIQKAYEEANESNYYTAASLAYKALIEYYTRIIDEECGYFISCLNKYYERLRNELNNIEEQVKNIKVTKPNLDVLVGLYERISQAKIYLSEARRSIDFLEFEKAYEYLAMAYVRIKTLYDWLDIAKMFENTSTVNVEFLKESTALYFMYAKALAEYGGLLSSFEREIEEIKDLYDQGLYLPALSKSLSVVVDITTGVFHYYLQSCRGECIEIWKKLAIHVRKLALYYTAILGEHGLVPILPLAYIEYGDYHLKNNRFEDAFYSYEMATHYAFALINAFKIRKSLNASSIIESQENIVNQTIPSEGKIFSTKYSIEYSIFSIAILVILISVTLIIYVTFRRVRKEFEKL